MPDLKNPITLLPHPEITGTVEHLPSSKSLSNRALLINAMMKGKATLENLSAANDTRLMHQLVRTPDEVIDVQDAGTVMRFLTAYYAISGQHKTITGTPRMQRRPIRELVDALRTLGAEIKYAAEEGYPPIHLAGFGGQKTDQVTVRGDVSSQFISALMMIAPALPRGLTIHLTGKVGSRPYLEMTASLMRNFGANVEMSRESIRVSPVPYKPAFYRVEPDWSATSYWLSFAALAAKANIFLPGVESESIQGDRVIVDIMAQLGVKSLFEPGGLRLKGGGTKGGHLTVDFRDFPDLAQTVLPACAVLGVSGEFTGMESLRIKETDRVAALEKELAKIGASLTESGSHWNLRPGKSLPNSVFIDTYEDHRMAMGFAPLATRTSIYLADGDVVRKSYPQFWSDLKGLGFTIS